MQLERVIFVLRDLQIKLKTECLSLMAKLIKKNYNYMLNNNKNSKSNHNKTIIPIKIIKPLELYLMTLHMH